MLATQSLHPVLRRPTSVFVTRHGSGCECLREASAPAVRREEPALAKSVLHPSAIRNHLLAALPSSVLGQLLPQMQPVVLDLHTVLHAPEGPVGAVHFVEAGWVSMIARLEDGLSAEVGLVGREGMVGLPLVFGIEISGVEVLVQGPGTALRMEAGAFRHALDEHPPLRTLLFRYGEFMRAQVTQTAACNGNHNLEQRLARWLLMSHDRANSDRFLITHEFMATMLCVHRPSVTVAARILQRVGLIRYGSGEITVVDRQGLEAVACECHRVVTRQYRKLLAEYVSR